MFLLDDIEKSIAEIESDSMAEYARDYTNDVVLDLLKEIKRLRELNHV